MRWKLEFLLAKNDGLEQHRRSVDAPNSSSLRRVSEIELGKNFTVWGGEQGLLVRYERNSQRCMRYVALKVQQHGAPAIHERRRSQGK